MYHSSAIEVATVEKLTTRDGFSEPYHKVTFDLISDGIPTSQMAVWVHPAYPDEELIRVARTFAWRRLLDLSEAANENIFSEEEVKSIWERVKPEEW